jgi:intein/homing endonuclease
MIFSQSADDRKVRQFSLSPTFIEQFRGKQPEWGFGGLGYFTYKRTYARALPEGGTEEFWQTVQRVVEGCFNIQKIHCRQMGLPWKEDKAQNSAQDMFHRIWDFKFTPPGRGLWTMGTDLVYERGAASLMNCFAGETEIITADGTKPIGSLVGTVQNLLTRGGEWVDAPIRSFGVQKLWRLVLTRQGVKKTLFVTGDHRWFCRDRRNANRNRGFLEFRTSELRPGVHHLQYIFGQGVKRVKPSPFGVAHGFTFGDGTCQRNRNAGAVYMFGEKDAALKPYFSLCPPHEIKNGAGFGALPNFFKDRPSLRETKAYLLGWLMGYFAADGSVEKAGQTVLSSADRGNIEFIRDVCVALGIGIYSIGKNSCISNLTGKPHVMYRLALMRNTLPEDFFLIDEHRNNFLKNGGGDVLQRKWTVLSVEETDREEEVFCAVVEGKGAFALDGNILTGNCSFISSENLADDFSSPFCFLMDMSMLGVGVGGDTRGAGKVKLCPPKITDQPFVVEDSREGWVNLLRMVLNSFVGKASFPTVIDYSGVRGRGVPIKTFGGVASGPKPLHVMVESITRLLLPKGMTVSFHVEQDETAGKIFKVGVVMEGSGEPYKITSSIIVDIFNMIGKCVVSGGIRRTAEILFGEPDDQEFIALKQDQEALNSHRWASNNSIFAKVGMDYSSVMDSVAVNGEPGLCWLDNMRRYGRMMDPPNDKDRKAMGANPCFSGDTLIAVADGRGSVPIRTLAENGNDIPVYAVDRKTGKVDIKWGRNPHRTRESSPLVEVLFEDGGSLRVTPDHGMLLLDGTKVHAEDLKPGDSLPRFMKRKEKISKANLSDYWQVCTDTRDAKSKAMEHRLVARFNDPEAWDRLYNQQKTNGWIKGGVVVHHEDFNSLNNAPENLSIMTFRNHRALHARSLVGNKNPMWGKVHSEEACRKIGDKTLERCSDPVFLAKLSASHTEVEREALSNRLSEQQQQNLLEYWKDQASKTDLDTVWVEGRLHAVKKCETCGEEFVVPWGKRGRCYCSIACTNEMLASLPVRKEAQRVVFEDMQHQTLHDQVMIHKDLIQTLGRKPLKKEWEAACKVRGVPCRIRFGEAGKSASNPWVVKSWAELESRSATYNHRVKEVRKVEGEEPVYNLTVDDYHTVAVITESERGGVVSGVFTAQCLEQTLFDRECCCLVETYPAHHDTYEDFQKTLKQAYLYAKTVTLVPTHDLRANAVMMKNRRIGCSMSGITQAIAKFGRREFLNWCDKGYGYIQELDRTYSDWLGIPLSIKTTSVKPSGCRPWYALTCTNRGILTLEELFKDHPEGKDWANLVDKTVADGSGQIIKTYVNGTVPVNRITLSYHLVLESTLNHRWRVIGKELANPRKIDGVSSRFLKFPTPEWVETKDLLPGHVLDVLPGVYKHSEMQRTLSPLSSIALKMRGDADEIRQPETMTPDLAWMLGYMWGDGAMSPSKWRLRWTDGIRENLDKLVRLFQDIFGISASINPISSENASTVEVGSKMLWHWLIKNGVFKYDADQLDLIPEVVRGSGCESIIAFVAGLLDADGSAGLSGKWGKAVVTTADERFARHLQDVCWAVGLCFGRSHQTQGSGFQKKKSMWHLTSSAVMNSEAFDLLVRHSVKASIYAASEGFPGWLHNHAVRSLRVGKVLSNEPVGEMPTFDVEVAKEHWYYAGAVPSHNTVSLLCGATPGIHYPHSEYYIRHVRVANTSPLVEAARKAGYEVYADVYAGDTSVVAFPVAEKNYLKGKDQVTVWEQFANAVDMQRHWADNQVSCLTGDTLIRTNSGFRRMSDIPSLLGLPSVPGTYPCNVPFQVLNTDNGWSSVSAILINPAKPLVEIEMEGLLTVKGTPDHRMRVLGESLELEWRNLSDIKKGDYLVEFLNSPSCPDSKSLLDFRLKSFCHVDRTSSNRDLFVPVTMTEALAELLGYMVSDGHLVRDCGSFGLTQRANNVVPKFKGFIKNLFGLDLKETLDVRAPSGDLLIVNGSSVKIHRWFEWVGLYDAELQKRVPWPISMSSGKMLKAFLRGITLDGHVSKRNGRIIVMTTESFRLAEELVDVLRLLGFQALITSNQKEGKVRVFKSFGKPYITSNTWCVSLSPEQSNRFFRMVGFAEDRKMETYHKFGDKKRRSLFGCVPDKGLRQMMRELSHRCKSSFMKDHFHSHSCHFGKAVSRQTLLQMSDMGVQIPSHLIDPSFTFRVVKEVQFCNPEPTYDMTVDDGHSYVANGFGAHNCTITFRPEEVNDAKTCLETFDDQLKGVSLLPMMDTDHGYAYPPYVAISREQYDEMTKKLRPIELGASIHEVTEVFCTNDTCELKKL